MIICERVRARKYSSHAEAIIDSKLKAIFVEVACLKMSVNTISEFRRRFNQTKLRNEIERDEISSFLGSKADNEITF